MNLLAVFVPLFLISFLLIPLLCYFVRIRNERLAKLCPPGSRCHRRRRQQRVGNQRQILNNNNDRQGNIFTISDETSGNTTANRYPDFFYLEPSSDEAARIRAQLEKDDKDLPSYDDVMRLTSLPATPMTSPQPPPPSISIPTTTTTAATAATSTTAPTTLGNTTSTTTISSSNSLRPSTPPPDMMQPPPSYSEAPPSYEASSSSNAIIASTSSIATASTSRGAAITIPITNSASNTSV